MASSKEAERGPERRRKAERRRTTAVRPVRSEAASESSHAESESRVLPEAPSAVGLSDDDIPAGATTTGRSIVLFHEDATLAEMSAFVESSTGLQVASAFDDFVVPEAARAPHGAKSMVFEELRVAIVPASMGKGEVMALEGGLNTRGVIAVEPERVVSVSGDNEIASTVDYLRGYRDGVVGIVETVSPLIGRTSIRPEASSIRQRQKYDEGETTWGLQLTKVASSKHTGTGIRIAVLDTGIDLTHPDVKKRASSITTKSFVSGQDVQDGHGHGTHCAGTAAGIAVPGRKPRYGVAGAAQLFVGKVLADSGRGTDAAIIAGIQWAVANGCQVVSMSLGAPATGRYSTVFDTLARRALAAGTLIVAAVGNDSQRARGVFRPVNHPANCPAIMAVGAVTSDLSPSDFSNQGQVDVAAPGSDVHSAWTMPTQYRTISGTSMATPHVAGVAALHAEATGARGSALWTTLVQTAQRLPVPSVDVGSGLVQAP